MTSLDQIPAIKMANVSFIKTAVLPNFIRNFANINPDFSFLSSLEDYMQYYTDFEIRGKESSRFGSIANIEGVGKLSPLRKKHTLHSYWKAYRLRIKNAKLEGQDLKELYFFLPLIIKFPTKSVKADGKNYSVNLFAHLFPFGVCCVNMTVKIDNQSLDFDQFIKLISRLRASVIDHRGSFDPFSLAVARSINQALFKDGQDVLVFPTHNLIFVKKTFPYLTYDENVLKDHAYAIASIMTGKKIDDMRHMTFDAIKEILSCQLKMRRDQEILFFSRSCTFLHPYRYWVEDEPTPVDVIRRLECMADNYQSFLNAIFSANRFLKYLVPRLSELRNDSPIVAKRLKEIVKGFNGAFPEITSDSEYTVNFKHALGPIAKDIGLYDSLKQLNE